MKNYSPSLLATISSGLIALSLCSPGFGQESNPLAVNQSKGLYTILIIHDGENIDPLTNSLVPLANATEKCTCLTSAIGNPGLRSIFRDLNLDPETAPTPLAIAISPNNVVTGVFMHPPTPEAFREAILPPQPLAIRKALIDGKSVIVKMQSSKTAGNSQTDAALKDFFSSRKNQKDFVTLPLDFHAGENHGFIRQLNIEPTRESASVLVALAPPLTVISNSFRGAATKSDIEKLVTPCGCKPGTV